MNSYLDQCLSDENEMFDGIKFSYNYDIEYFYLLRICNLYSVFSNSIRYEFFLRCYKYLCSFICIF